MTVDIFVFVVFLSYLATIMPSDTIPNDTVNKPIVNIAILVLIRRDFFTDVF